MSKLSNYQQEHLRDAIRDLVFALTDPTIGKQAWDAIRRLAEHPSPEAIESVQNAIESCHTEAVFLAVDLTTFADESLSRLCGDAEQVASNLAKVFAQPASDDTDRPDAA